MAWAETLKAKYILVMLLTALLTACGGESSESGGPSFGGGGTIGDEDGDTDDDGSQPTSDITYFPLQVAMQGSDYVEQDVFEGVWFAPLIHGYLIAPVDGETLEPATDVSVDEFIVTINGEAVDAEEQGLMMQPVLGLQSNLSTAIIIDTSSSTQAVDKNALIQEVKDFIADAQNSPDPAIRDQRFSLWAFGDEVQLLSNFTTDASALSTALDSLAADWTARGNASALYESIVWAIGTYVGSGSSENAEEDDMSADGDNDLIDGLSYSSGVMEAMNLSTLVMFSTGNNSVHYYDEAAAQAALDWQSFLVYSEDAAEEGDEESGGGESVFGDGMTLLSRPLIYVALGTDTDADLSSMAATTIETGSDTDFGGVAEQIVQAQSSAIELRKRQENQYLIRYALAERDGTHQLILASNTGGYDFTLTTDLDLATGGPWADPQVSPVVEITGPDNSYLAASTVSLADATTLYPATRWTTLPFSAGDYSWTVGGSPRAANADGSVTLTGADAGATVVLTNTSLSTGTTSASVSVTN
ncbi:MAG: hypothetical protein CMI02_03445 [Oceanospirillaceae bacterium]|nr:hypothetical protein [Oceanospirillaceae bacterium]MBT11072.1 hypothetical protein [Oceanospirillaceae bacterium]|tara:strand:+ start:15357 stop:16946 length:1590 start_codon:yes stop_codon:yes gene_type:complete